MQALTATVQAEIKRRRRFLAAVLRGEKPRGETRSYLRLNLITINPDGVYSITPKGRKFLEPDYFKESDDPRSDKAQPIPRAFPFPAGQD